MIMSLEKISRNKDILVRNRAGESYQELAKEYGISRERVIQIVQRERFILRQDVDDIPAIEKACCDLNASKGMYFRIINALHEARLDNLNKWKRLDRVQMLSIRNIGERAADILEYAQSIAKLGEF